MELISSSIEGSEWSFEVIQDKLALKQFTLGGNWDYRTGSFDCALDQEHKVWLRMPFEVIAGEIDSQSDSNAQVRMGEPYILRHLYNEGNDPEATVRVVGALFDQFQAPVDPDAEISSHWINRGKDLMGEIETLLMR